MSVDPPVNERQFGMWRLIWWMTFVSLTLAVLANDGLWSAVPGLALCLLFVGQVWFDRTGL